MNHTHCICSTTLSLANDSRIDMLCFVDNLKDLPSVFCSFVIISRMFD